MTTTPKTNRFAAKCEDCGRTVPAGAGTIKGKMIGGTARWLVVHTECPMPTPPKRNTETHQCLVHGPADDECLGDRCLTGRTTRPVAQVCARHGNAHEAGFLNGCWECDMEAAIARRDDAEERRRMDWKMGR